MSEMIQGHSRRRDQERRTDRRHPMARVAARLVCVAMIGLAVLAAAGAPAAWAAGNDPVVGEMATFRVNLGAPPTRAGIVASVSYVSDRSVVYVQKGLSVPASAVSTLADDFDAAVYPRLTEELGPEPDPGVDGSSRIVILVYDMADPQLSGYFDRQDIEPSAAGDPESNHREMFYLNVSTLLAGREQAAAGAAHEFAHLIQHYRDFMLDPSPERTAEARWMEEGISMYAQSLAGFGGPSQDRLRSFELEPSKNLTLWVGGFYSDYGASLAFVSYVAERTSPGFVRALVEEPLDGVAGLNTTLARFGYFDTFATLFDDWVIANFLDGRGRATPPWTHQSFDLAVEAQPLMGAGPWAASANVKNYAARYLDLPAVGEGSIVRAVVDGQDGAPLRAGLISWDPEGNQPSVVTPLHLQPGSAGGTATAPPGLSRHALVVWARGPESADLTYSFRYSVAVDPAGAVQFLDVGSEHPFFPYIEALRAAGVVSGREVPPGSGLWYFRSGDLVLRAQFAKMAVEVAGLHTAEVEALGQPTFTDVPLLRDPYGDPVAYPYDYVEEAAAAGIVGGYPDGGFRPWDPMKRIHLVRMILRAASAAGRPLESYTGAERVFSDVPPGSALYRDVMTAYTNGIMSGSPDGAGGLRLDPWGSATRGHVAKMTANLMDLLVGLSE